MRPQHDHGVPLRALVTVAAGFIGSHVVEQLCAQGWRVRGVDAFTTYYDPAIKWRNLAGLESTDTFELVNGDLAALPLDDLLRDVDVVFHQAGQPGIRLSWADGFPTYLAHNVQATQRLLEAAKGHRLERFVFACSSSVYGEAARYPTTEADLPQPHSPYGVTKLAAEPLCQLYAANRA